MNGPAYRRFQLTLFLPEPTASLVNDVRQRWDPIMAARIDPHVTVLRRIANPESALSTIRRDPRVRACRLRLDGVGHAAAGERGGIFVKVVDVAGDLAVLWDALREADNHAEIQPHPHVTLLHPRTMPPERMDAAWRELAEWQISAEIVIDEIVAIGETTDSWKTIATTSLMSR